MESVKEPDGAIYFRKKPASDGLMSDFESLGLLDVKLHNILGDWIPYMFSYHAFYATYRGARDLVEIVGDNRSEAVGLLLDALKARRAEVDAMIRKLHDVQGSFPKELSQPSLACAVQTLVNDEIEQTDCEDRWFYSLCEKTPLYMASLGCVITEDDVESIAEKHFESWIQPNEDAVLRFADELAAIGIKQIFESQYGCDVDSDALDDRKLMATVEHLVGLLAAGRFHELEVLTDTIRMRAEEIRDAVESYPGRVVSTVRREDIDVIRINTPNKECWSVNVNLHTETEAPSDLTMSLTLIQSDTGRYNAELDDIHVL